MPADRYICPGCGKEVGVGSDGCPTCNPAKPWEQDENLDGLDLDLPEDDNFDYEEFTRREFGGGAKSAGLKPIWIGAAIAALLALAASRFFF